jgi:hypothetical protein
MSPTMLVQGIKSRPVYRTLAPRPGPAHLFVADGEGALAILDLVAIAPPSLWTRARIAYVPGASAAQAYGERLAALGAESYDERPAVTSALPLLGGWLDGARMGTQVYLAGTEVLIGRAMQVALQAGVDHSAIQAEHRGSLARRVQCVHCKGITEDVHTQPVRCASCGLMLLVRDHYSRRYGAFMGVNIDAEDPGLVPPAETPFA